MLARIPISPRCRFLVLTKVPRSIHLLPATFNIVRILHANHLCLSPEKAVVEKLHFVFVSEFKARVLCFPFQLDMREQLSITDYKGREIGYLNVSMVTPFFFI